MIFPQLDEAMGLLRELIRSVRMLIAAVDDNTYAHDAAGQGKAPDRTAE